MSNVKRYDFDSDDPSCFVTESLDGGWVHFTDLETLRAENERLKELVEKMEIEVAHLNDSDLRQLEYDLRSARKAMEEIGSHLIGAKEAFRDPDIQGAERYCDRALAALNAELEKETEGRKE